MLLCIKYLTHLTEEFPLFFAVDQDLKNDDWIDICGSQTHSFFLNLEKYRTDV